MDFAAAAYRLGELFVPRACAGCQAPGEILCARCRQHLRQAPHRISRSRDIGAPVFALGPYSDIRRNLIVAMKEYNNTAVRRYVGAVYAAGLEHLRARGELPHEFEIVPAPTRARSARLRGGDPLTHIGEFAAAKIGGVAQPITVRSCVRIRSHSPDQSRLSAEQRWANMADAIECYRPVGNVQLPAVIIDDVVTTGATLAGTVRCLRGAGMRVAGAVVLADV